MDAYNISVNHSPLDKMAAISQTILSDTIYWMIILYFDYSFTEVFFLMVLDNGLAPNRRQAIIWTNTDPIHCRIYRTLE